MKILKRIKKISWVKKTQHRIELIILRLFMLLIWSGNPGGLQRGAETAGWFAFKVLGVRKKIVLDNLRKSFPEKDEQEITYIAYRTYVNFTKTVIDYIRFPILTKAQILQMCTIEGKQHLDWVQKNGKGAVIVAGHFGSWELMGAALSHMGYPISYLVGEQHNKRVDDIMNEYREMMGIHIIHMGVAVRGVIRTLRNNGMVALLADQNAGKEGIFVDFLGRKASAHQGPAVFALKTGAPIIYGSTTYQPGGKYKLNIELLTFENLKKLSDENIRTVTQAHLNLLEKSIRQNPDHWFWMHRRWKTRPPEERKKQK